MQRPNSSLAPRAASLTLFALALVLGAATACGPPAYATIGAPVNDATYAVGDSIWFHGEVNSNEPLGIDVEGDFRWTSDLDGELGDTPLFIRTDLSAGEHLITLRVRNSAGLVLRDQVRIFLK